jgi:hypothetical protein
VAIGSILSPLTNDTRIFYGVQYLAYKYFPFPQGISYVWEIKPIASHIFNYILVVFTCALVPFSDHFAQEIIIKTIAIGIAVLASWLFARNILKIKYSFLLCFLSFFACLNLNVLQMEWLGVAFSMIACALFVEENKLWHYIAGALLILVLLLKGTTGALIVCAICVVLIFHKKIDWVRGGIGFISMGLLFFVASQTIWPEMLSDIYMSPILSHVGEYNILGQVGVIAIATAICMSIYIPVVGLGLVYGGIWIKNHIHTIEAKLLIICWLILAGVMVIQSESFPYQFFPFVLPAVTGLILYERDTPIQKPGKKLKRENVVATSIVILFIMWCILYSPQPIWGLEQNYGVQELKMNNYFNENANAIEVKFNLSKEKSLLYLDTGSGPYYVNGVNTSCRYVAPLVLQRANPNRTIVSNLPQYWDQYECVMNYNNKYILADGPLGKDDGWFGTDTPEKIAIVNKVHDEYTEVFSGAWSVYEKRNISEMLNLT